MNKNRDFNIILGFLAILFIFLAIGLLVYNQPQRMGSFTEDSNKYLMDFELLNGKYSHTMELNEGDVLAVHLEKSTGNYDVSIELIADGVHTAIYTGNDVTGGDFELPIEKAGSYEITLKANHAVGVANFVVK